MLFLKFIYLFISFLFFCNGFFLNIFSFLICFFFNHFNFFFKIIQTKIQNFEKQDKQMMYKKTRHIWTHRWIQKQHMDNTITTEWHKNTRLNGRKNFKVLSTTTTKKTPKWKDELSTTIESKFCSSRIDEVVFFDVEVDCVKVEIKVECVKPKSNLRSTT
jgi:hypothetical protein